MGVTRIPVGGVPTTNFYKDIGWRNFNYDAALISGNKPPGVRSASFTDTPQGYLRVIGTPAGADKICEVVEGRVTGFENYVKGDASLGKTIFDSPFYYSMVMNCYTPFGPSTGERYMGIEWGSFLQPPPFQTSYTLGDGGVIQFRWNFTLSRWEVCVWDNDLAVPPTIIPTLINPLFSADLYTCEISMEYTPAISTATGPKDSKLTCVHEGVTILDLNNHPRVNNLLLSGSSNGAGYFITNGSDITAGTSDAIFSSNRIYQKRSRLSEL